MNKHQKSIDLHSQLGAISKQVFDFSLYIWIIQIWWENNNKHVWLKCIMIFMHTEHRIWRMIYLSWSNFCHGMVLTSLKVWNGQINGINKCTLSEYMKFMLKDAIIIKLLWNKAITKYIVPSSIRLQIPLNFQFRGQNQFAQSSW